MSRGLGQVQLKILVILARSRYEDGRDERQCHPPAGWDQGFAMT